MIPLTDSELRELRARMRATERPAERAAGSIITATIPLPVPTSNEWTFKQRWAYTKHRDVWYAHLTRQLGLCEFSHTGRPFVQVVTWRSVMLDYWNLCAGCKPIPDALVKLGYLVDDDPEHMAADVRQLKSKRADQRTVVTVYYASSS